MKKLLVIFAVLVSSTTTFAQTDKQGNPIFNSIMVSEEKISDTELSSNYYTLKNNIENKGSSVFVAATPTLSQIENAATSLLSDFYILTKNGHVVNLILLSATSPRNFIVINPADGSGQKYACKIKGDISENRAKEIVSNGYDSKTSLQANELVFNGHHLRVFSSEEVKSAVVPSGYVLTPFLKLLCKSPKKKALGAANVTTACPLSWPWWAKWPAAS